MQKHLYLPQQANRKRVLYFLFLFIIFFTTSLAVLAQSSPNDLAGTQSANAVDWTTSWSMAGANPQRSSWTAEEVRGRLQPVWYKPFEPYISQKVQIIAANDLLYVATSAGLYALNADNGSIAWVYPTDMPLGHSPTIYNGVAYVGGFDHKIHAIDALTGAGLWTFEAGAGFNTNPLVVEGKLFAGNRDGYFYAIHVEGPDTGKLAWKFKTGGPILYSAAYQDGVVFFASNDSYAYALNAAAGSLVWKSAKLPGAGFFSYWPVVYQDRVIFSGSNNYRFGEMLGVDALVHIERDEFYAGLERGTPIGPVGTGSGDWAAG
ncbi:MAG: PQQ-binding-like beta-propeller repeat protein, partial [Anaerolineae bacterium]